MRVVAGKLRHRNINMTNLPTTRETQDKVREAIFNMIGPYFDGGVCLDLFAGSGAMGIEAFSRGMERIVLNDLNKDALNVCKENCKSLKIDNVNFFNMDYEVYLNQCKDMFDLIILDPPYKMNDIEKIIKKCKPFLNQNGLIVFEMDANTNYLEEYDNLVLMKDKKYGIKRVVIYEKEES